MCVCRGRKFDGGSSTEFLQALHAADTEVGTGPEAGPERGTPAFHRCPSWSQGGACWESASCQRLQGNCFWHSPFLLKCTTLYALCINLVLLYTETFVYLVLTGPDQMSSGQAKFRMNQSLQAFSGTYKKCLNIITQNWY